jgi:hypothetical protein
MNQWSTRLEPHPIRNGSKINVWGMNQKFLSRHRSGWDEPKIFDPDLNGLEQIEIKNNKIMMNRLIDTSNSNIESTSTQFGEHSNHNLSVFIWRQYLFIHCFVYYLLTSKRKVVSISFLYFLRWRKIVSIDSLESYSHL